MPASLKKFVNPKFIRTVDLALIRTLLQRHDGALKGFDLATLDGDEARARERLHAYLLGATEQFPEGLIADLHQIADLGCKAGLELILTHARRLGVQILEPAEPDQGDAPKAHDPKHVALRVFLFHRAVFDAAYDFQVLKTKTSLIEFAGLSEGVAAKTDISDIERFREAVSVFFEADMRGRYCRLACYEDGRDINIVIAHGAVVSSLPVIEANAERVISMRAVTHAVLRYEKDSGMLRLGGISRTRAPDMADMFAGHLLDLPGFFAGPDARHLYSLDAVEQAGPGFAMTHAHDPAIEAVLITTATAELWEWDASSGGRKRVRTRSEKSSSGNVLANLFDVPTPLGGAWRLCEVGFEVVFKSTGKRRDSVSVTLRPPAILRFRRSSHEDRIITLLQRNGLVHDRDDLRVIAAAE
ncbi:MAG: hypothetical protein GXP05_11180 [Alphaproteobacteria bacterium]|nr:hypothetical protein [Alphaproteobacteria bacterium]